VAGCHPSQDCPGEHRLAQDVVAGRHDGQHTCGGDAESVHCLADHVLAKHRTDRRLAVASACKARSTGAFEVKVAALSRGVDHLAD
jgi:hypothetical protein